MDFFDKLGKKVTEGYNVAAEKTKEIAREAKLKISISESKEKIDNEYKKIGKTIYEKFLEKRDEDIAISLIEEFKTIDRLNEDIKNAENEILGLKDMKKCEQCGSEIDENAEFCAKCGNKFPKEEKQVFEAEIVKEEDQQ